MISETSPLALHDVSAIVGELRNFSQQQSITNVHMLEELKKINERMSAFSETGATFVEYRKTLHERFGAIHEQMAHIDATVDRLLERVGELEVTVATWKSNWKLLVTVFLIISSFTSAIITHYGSAIVKNL